MSTTFEVYPRAKEMPSFATILERATNELHRFLGSVGLRSRPAIHMRLQRCADNAHLPFSPGDPARWDKDTYGWFMVGDVPGGTDAYFDDDTEEIWRLWDGEFDD